MTVVSVPPSVLRDVNQRSAGSASVLAWQSWPSVRMSAGQPAMKTTKRLVVSDWLDFAVAAV
jgi:hypothetical protein